MGKKSLFMYKSCDISRIPLHIAQLFLYTIAADILLSELAFILGRAISWYTLPLSFLVGVLVLSVFYGEPIGKKLVYEIAAAIFIFLFLSGVVGKIWDFSWDGNAYHKLAIGFLKNHWNPIYGLPSQAFSSTLRAEGDSLWVECYSKGTWIFAAGVYGITGNIETGKVYTLIAMVCAFLLTYYCLRKHRKNVLLSVLFSLLAASNPVAMAQMLTFYVDGYLHIMLYILALVLAVMVEQEENVAGRRTVMSLVLCAMLICGTCKFTGLAYGGVYCVVYFLFYAVRQLKAGKAEKWKRIGSRLAEFAGVAGVTILWGGADTYIMNTLRHRSPLYPLYGEGAVDIMTANSPFTEVNHFKNLFVSLFSKMDNMLVYQGIEPQRKIPFFVDWETERAFVSISPDIRISGFGVWFSGVLLIALAFILLYLVRRLARKQEESLVMKFLLWLLALNVILSFSIAESWWARYAPYIYFIVLFGFFLIVNTGAKSKGKWVKGGTVLLLLVFLTNNLLFLYGDIDQWKSSMHDQNSIRALRGYSKVEVYAETFPGLYFNLEDQGVRYSIKNNDESVPLGTGDRYDDIRFTAE